MAATDGSAMLVFNGEIYNFRELRRELQAEGAQFHTDGDSEVILAAWQRWGVDCLPRLHGMFAFALYDLRQRTLLLARDRLGVKPLFTAQLADGSVIFGSELKALLAHPMLRRDIDPLAIEDYLAWGYVPDHRSILKGVEKLPAGHYRLLRHDAPPAAPVQWWDISFADREPGNTADLGAPAASPARGGDLAHDGRRAAGCLPFGRGRQFQRRGADGGSQHRSGEDLQHRLRRAGAGRDGLCRQGGRAVRHRPLQAGGGVGRFRADRPAGGHVRRAFRRCLRPADVPGLRTCARACDRGAFRRWRGRSFRRIPPAGVPASRGIRAALLPQGLRAPVFGTLGRLWPKADWAPRPLRAKATFLNLARSGEEGYARSLSVTPVELRNACMARISCGCGAIIAPNSLCGDDAPGAGAFRAGPGAIRRSQVLSARRHSDQGGPDEHGGQP
jgi:asparagine synthase (glutamine-hydrolysing)